jgi:hypothetical protein
MASDCPNPLDVVAAHVTAIDLAEFSTIGILPMMREWT